MTKSICLFLLLPIASMLWSQSENSASSRQREMGFDLGVTMNYRLLTAEKGNSSAQSIVDMRDELEKVKPGVSLGCHINLPIRKNWHLGLSATYMNMGYIFKTTTTLIYPNNQIDFADIKYTYNYHSVLLPISMKYFDASKKMSVIYGFGLGPHVILFGTRRAVTTIGNTPNSSKDGADTPFTFAIFGQASLGLRIQITEKLSTRIEWVNNMDASLINPTPVRGRLFNSGIQLGIYF
jgi:hypothetical protein